MTRYSMSESQLVTETSIPHFLLKLWKLVEDSRFNRFIYWDESGLSFHIVDQHAFSREVLPLYFKHNNLNSFIRQLNMYGFRKVSSLEQGSMRPPKNDAETLEFQHPYFVRDHPDLLTSIRRKNNHVSRVTFDNLALQQNLRQTPSVVVVPSDTNEQVMIDGKRYVVQTSTPSLRHSSQDAGSSSSSGAILARNVIIPAEYESNAVVEPKIERLIEEMQRIRHKQIEMEQRFSNVQLENDTLWREVALMRKAHLKQQEIVNKLVKFLMAFANRTSLPSTSGSEGTRYAKRPLLAIGSSASQEPLSKTRRLQGPIHQNQTGTSLSSYYDFPELLMSDVGSSDNLENTVFVPSSISTETVHQPIRSADSMVPTSIVLKTSSNNFSQPSGNTTVQSGLQMENVNWNNIKTTASTSGGKLMPTLVESPDLSSSIQQTVVNDNPASGLTIYDVTHEFMNKIPSKPNESLIDPSDSGQFQSLATVAGTSTVPFEDQSINVDSTLDQVSDSLSSTLPPNSAYVNQDYSSFANSTEMVPSTVAPLTDQLNYIQSDLDEIRDLLSSNDFNLSAEDLNDLFSSEIDTPLYDIDMQQEAPAQARRCTIGNEVQIYKPPALPFSSSFLPTNDQMATYSDASTASPATSSTFGHTSPLLTPVRYLNVKTPSNILNSAVKGEQTTPVGPAAATTAVLVTTKNGAFQSTTKDKSSNVTSPVTSSRNQSSLVPVQVVGTTADGTRKIVIVKPKSKTNT